MRRNAENISGLAGGTRVPGYRQGMEFCTLPIAERPARLAEFADLFSAALRGQQRLAPTALRWRLDPAAEPTARDLTARESSCCSFFSFAYSTAGGELVLDVTVPPDQAPALDILAWLAG